VILVEILRSWRTQMIVLLFSGSLTGSDFAILLVNLAFFSFGLCLGFLSTLQCIWSVMLF
jgi:hypothetical protein